MSNLQLSRIRRAADRVNVFGRFIFHGLAS